MRRTPAIFPALVLILAVVVAAPAGVSAQDPPAAGESAGPPRTGETAGSPGAGKAAGPADYPEGLVHAVVEGDTLWDLSAKYLGTPWKWSELWERNRFLTNPHHIYPGIRVVIFPPPSKDYAFARGGEPPPEPPAAPPEPVAAPVQAPPPPPKPAGPPMLDIKPLDFVCGGEFLRAKPSGIGHIKNAREPKVVFSENDRVYLKLSKEIPAGQLLAVYRVRGPIDAPGDGRISGYVKYLVGILQATGRTEGETAALVRTSFEDLTKDDIVSEEIPAYAPVFLNPGAEGLNANVIAGRLEKVELSTGDFVYLDKGTAAGIAIGNVFRIFDGRTGSSGVPLEEASRVRSEVARAVVIRSSAEFATAYIVKSLQSFQTGTEARRGTAATP